MFIVLDELPKPKQISSSLEEVIMNKIRGQCARKYPNQELCSLLGAIRIESHSTLLMQLCDVLLGAVMFDYKKGGGIISDKLQRRKEEVVAVLREGVGKSMLATPFTVHKPVYFHVWNAVWEQK